MLTIIPAVVRIMANEGGPDVSELKGIKCIPIVSIILAIIVGLPSA